MENIPDNIVQLRPVAAPNEATSLKAMVEMLDPPVTPQKRIIREALLYIFPVTETRRPSELPVLEYRNNVVVLENRDWFEILMRKLGLALKPHQLMITQEKRLLLVDYTV